MAADGAIGGQNDEGVKALEGLEAGVAEPPPEAELERALSGDVMADLSAFGLIAV
jgi:hypothetical protein